MNCHLKWNGNHSLKWHIGITEFGNPSPQYNEQGFNTFCQNAAHGCLNEQYSKGSMEHSNSKNNLKIDFNIYILSLSLLSMGSHSVNWSEGVLEVCFYGNQIQKINLLNTAGMELRRAAG